MGHFAGRIGIAERFERIGGEQLSERCQKWECDNMGKGGCIRTGECTDKAKPDSTDLLSVDSSAIFKQAIDKWGRESQIDMTIEECAELIKALCKLKRKHHPSDTAALIHDICEELADVRIMSGQMRYVFGADEVDGWYDEKMERLQKLLG